MKKYSKRKTQNRSYSYVIYLLGLVSLPLVSLDVALLDP